MIIFDKINRIYYSNLINDESYFSGFSTKRLGNGLRESTLFRFFDRLGTSYKKIVTLNQIHSANSEIYTYVDDGTPASVLIKNIDDTDGVLTRDSNIILVARTADCVPIIYADKENGIIGSSHQGWRGSLKKLQTRMVENMVKLGGKVSSIKIAIGPSIGECCYEVQEDLYHNFEEELPQYIDQVFSIKGGKRYLNLIKLNYLLLMDAGIPKENIDIFPFCTKCNEKSFFSYRREGKKLQGEMFNFIVRK